MLNNAPEGQGELQELVDDYLDHCRARNLSLRTIRDNYRYALNIWLEWCRTQDIDRLEEVTNAVLNRYSIHLQTERLWRGRHLRPASVKTYVEAVNWWLRWCQAEGHSDRRPQGQVPKLPRRILDVLTQDEIKRMVDVCGNDRDRLMIEVLAHTGIRLEEMTTLVPESLIRRGRRCWLRIEGKGRRQREVRISEAMYKGLERMARNRPDDAEGPQLFLNNRRRPGGGHSPLTRRVVEKTVSLIAEQARIGRRVYPHLFRHS